MTKICSNCQHECVCKYKERYISYNNYETYRIANDCQYFQGYLTCEPKKE